MDDSETVNEFALGSDCDDLNKFQNEHVTGNGNDICFRLLCGFSIVMYMIAYDE